MYIVVVSFICGGNQRTQGKPLSCCVALGPSWLWSYGSWIFNYLCNECLWYHHWSCAIRARCTTLCDKDCQWLATGRCFSPGPPVSSINKTDRHDIAEILLKVVLNTMYMYIYCICFCSFHSDNIYAKINKDVVFKYGYHSSFWIIIMSYVY
jgi:hypothetical protein